jgi:hypothetical protein
MDHEPERYEDLHPLPDGLRWAYRGCGCHHDSMDRGSPIVRDVHGEAVGRVCPDCGLVG